MVSASLGTVLVFWAVTPLQSAIFATNNQSIVHPVVTTHFPTLVPVDTQVSALDVGFMNQAYSILWLGAPVPAFTTRRMALSPFNVTHSIAISPHSDTLTAETDAYWTELECQAAGVSLPQLDGATTSYNFSNGVDCVASAFLQPFSGKPDQYILNYIPYWFNDDTVQTLQGPSCPPSASHNFLALAASASSIQSTLVAEFCSPAYYTQRVEAIVTLPDYSVVSTTPSGPRSALDESLFNFTHFEYLIGQGESESHEYGDWPNSNAAQQDLKVAQLHVEIGWDVMVGFALGNKNVSTSQYLNSSKLHQAYEAAHQLLFALAINHLHGSTSSVSSGTVSYQIMSIIVVRGFAIAVEISLGLVALATLALLIIYWNRPNRLASDPASISDLMKLLPDAERLDPLFLNSGGLDALALETKFHGERFQLDFTGKIVHVQDPSMVEKRQLSSKPIHSQQSATKVRPLELRYPIGVPFAFLLLSAAILLGVLLQQTKVHRGLSRPSDNIIARQVILNYLPTAFATLVEPTWVLLNRLLCVLQPFEGLRTGQALASNSIDLKYTSLPPQLVAFRALRAKHFLLASICTTALLANVLTISLSSIFEDDITSVTTDSSFGQTTASLLTGELLAVDHATTYLIQEKPLDHWYLLKAYYADGARLPAWTTPDFYFVPYEPENVTGDFFLHQATTRGFGISSTCQTISSTNGPNEVDLHLSSNGSFFQFMANPDAADPKLASCLASDLESHFSTANDGWMTSIPRGPSSLESIEHLTLCGDFLVTSWFHANFTLPPAKQALQSLDYVMLSCNAKLLTAEFLTSINSANQVVSTKQHGPFATDVTPYLTPNITEESIISGLNDLMHFATWSFEAFWHNDSFAEEYFNFLLKPLLNGTNTDALAPIPPASVAAPLVQKMHTTMFAVILALSPTGFGRLPSDNKIPGKAFSFQHRTFMSTPMTAIAISILSLNFIVAVVLYLRRPGKWLPRMPLTVAGVLGFVGGTWEIRTASDKPRNAKPGHDENQVRWGFGKYMGRDGKVKIGIERWPFVQPLVFDSGGDKQGEQAILPAEKDAQGQERLEVVVVGVGHGAACA